jgi:hypothetical protein
MVDALWERGIRAIRVDHLIFTGNAAVRRHRILNTKTLALLSPAGKTHSHKARVSRLGNQPSLPSQATPTSSQRVCLAAKNINQVFRKVVNQVPGELVLRMKVFSGTHNHDSFLAITLTAYEESESLRRSA